MFISYSQTINQKNDLSNYPNFFKEFDSMNFVFVIGENAKTKDVISSLNILKSLSEYASKENLFLPNIVAYLDSEIDSVFNYNAIIVGGPCANSAASEFLNYPLKCTQDFKPQEGKIMLKNQNNKIQILVAGLYADDTLFAAKTLSNYDKTNLSNNLITIRESEIYDFDFD
jgi:hypothetical protein